jgi:hypothetical protein
MSLRNITKLFLFGSLLIFLTGCQKNIFQSPSVAPVVMRDVPALRLNFRYEADVPAPPEAQKNAPAEQRNAAIQNDFDQNRPQEILDKTIASPDGQRVLAIYHHVSDVQAEFRLDMYAADGKLLHKITPDSMAVHFPDTIVWSPDSTTLAFVAMTRAGEQGNGLPQTTPQNPDANANSANANSAANTENPAANANTDVEANANSAVPAAPTPAAPTGILTFRTEQIYTCNSDGDGVKPVTQNEGLIYFYYVWSPDSTMLASLAATYREWQFLQYQADQKGEIFVPLGRPRLVEKTGRERRLDDALTQVQPVWSPDSAKVGVAYDRQIRIYDAIGNNPTQAAVPLRNQLLLSSQAYDQELQRKEAANGAVDTNENAANTAANNQPQQPTTLPDESSLVSYNPIIDLEWTSEDMLYFQTGYVKQMKNDADSVRSYLRWHRLILSPQAVSLAK